MAVRETKRDWKDDLVFRRGCCVRALTGLYSMREER